MVISVSTPLLTSMRGNMSRLPLLLLLAIIVAPMAEVLRSATPRAAANRVAVVRFISSFLVDGPAATGSVTARSGESCRSRAVNALVGPHASRQRAALKKTICFLQLERH